MLTRATGTPADPTADSKRHALLSASVWLLSELLRPPFPFLLDFDLRETFRVFRRPSSRVLFFGRLQYRSFLDDSNTVWPLGDFRHSEETDDDARVLSAEEERRGQLVIRLKARGLALAAPTYQWVFLLLPAARGWVP